jgi:putative hydrolase of the HAD superfamily
MSRPQEAPVAERPELEAVIFDAGGTLVRLDFEWMAAISTRVGHRTTTEAMRRAEVAGRRRYDGSGTPADLDKVQPLGARGDIRAYFGGMLLATGMPHHLVGSTLIWFLARERTSGLWSRPHEGARAAIDAVARLGLRRSVISNSDGRAAWHLEQSGVLDGLEFVVDSHEFGVEKPDPRIFAHALERLGVAPDRAIYVGDIRSVDEVGARAAGLRFVLIDPYGDYAGTDTPRIRSIGELPAWLERNYTLVPAADHAVPHGARGD